jgi:hypothetical protein
VRPAATFMRNKLAEPGLWSMLSHPAWTAVQEGCQVLVRDMDTGTTSVLSGEYFLIGLAHKQKKR